jgi:hypothetical protein
MRDGSGVSAHCYLANPDYRDHFGTPDAFQARRQRGGLVKDGHLVDGCQGEDLQIGTRSRNGGRVEQNGHIGSMVRGINRTIESK